jgi:hypothetical protein
MAAVKDYKRFTQISQILNFTFGTPGPGAGDTPAVTTHKVNLVALNEELVNIKFQMAVTIPTTASTETFMKDYNKEAHERIKASLKAAAKLFKETFPDEKSIEFKIRPETEHENIEIIHAGSNISFSYHRPTLRGFYRLSLIADIK